MSSFRLSDAEMLRLAQLERDIRTLSIVAANGWTVDTSDSYSRGIEEELSKDTEREVCPCTANSVEQSHRRVKHRYYPILELGEFDAAQRFCRAGMRWATF